MFKEGKKEKIIGIVILAVAIISIVIIKAILDSKSDKNLKVVYGAVGGGKEDFIADERINEILEKEYKIKFVADSWGNGDTIRKPLVRETVHYGNTSIPESQLSVNNDQCSKYDLLFTSDERYLTYYRGNPKDEEAERYRVLKGSLTLNTPIVFYSWDTVVDALMKENIVTEEDGVYYITDPNKLIDYILQDKTWKDIGLNDLFGNINIASVDPVSSSPGATYYGLLLTILTNGNESNEAIEAALPKLKQLYDKSGYMGITPADLFEKFMKIGQGTYPLIVDYEKSLMEFRNRDKEGYNNVKDHLRILYSKPTVTNSHCIATFTENGNEFLKAFDDKKIQEIAWKNYGFRVSGTGGTSDVSVVDMPGIPSKITSGAKGLKMDTYNRLIEYLEKGE